MKSRLYQQEKLIFDAGEMIATALEGTDTTRAELARRMGRTRAFITHILSGERNLTMRTFADAMTCLGFEVSMSAKEQGDG